MRSFAMHAPRFRTVSQQRRFGWLLWLALLLPMAQLAATCHALSHTGAEASAGAYGKDALHAAHCDLCLIAAAVSGGAPLAEPPSFTHPTTRHALPQTAFNRVWIASATQAYRSRAPPLAPH